MARHIQALAVLAVSLLIATLLAGGAEAHRSGCHRWHSCPSDRGTYICGDLGYSAYCPKTKTRSKPKPKAVDLTGPAQVIDGDTIKIGGERIRLVGIDAPEMRQTCRMNGRGWPAGKDATAWLKSVLGGKTISCTREGRDAYKRVLATCFAEGVNVNEAMVAAGWAMAYRQYSERYVAAEEAARKAKRGIWEGVCQAPWDWRRLNR